jgi:hypothetical protein
MKPLARMVLLDLVAEFKILFHELFVMEVNLFYEDTLNKVGGEHPTNATRTQCCNGSTPDQRILPLRGA